jgi:Type II secretion system (T2SS), protein K
VAQRRQEGGYILILVLALIAVGSFVALRFAERNDTLRRSALGLAQYVEGQQQAASALAAARYWMATRPLHPMGHADGQRVLREDGRWYRHPDGGWVAVQDHRGLLSVNALDRDAVVRLLVQEGLEPQAAQTWLDVLQDYQDTDSLHRVNGAERDEYRALGLPAPRNDWLISLRELEQLPRWRDQPAITRRVARWLHTAINNQFNLNTAAPAVLKARYPGLSDAQLRVVEGLRQADLLRDVRSAAAATDLPLDEESVILVPGYTSRITVWAPGLPQALDYNLRLTPAGLEGPWTVREQQPAPRPAALDEPSRAALFPLYQPVQVSAPTAASSAQR